MLRRLLLLLGLLGLTLGSWAHAAAAPRIELTLAPAWKGWSRPGRMTELDIRLVSDAATRVNVQLAAGRTTVHTNVDLQPGRVVRLQMAVSTVQRVEVGVTALGGDALLHRDVGLSLSESPLLALGLSGSETIELEGFHSVALTVDDLPRNASAYASIDALVIDAATLASLDQRQLAALLAHAAACGRIVVVNADPQVRRLLAGAGGCGGQALMDAPTPLQAKNLLAASLGTSLPPAVTLAGLGDLARPAQKSWNRVALALSVYFAAAVLVLVFMMSLPALLLLAALASLAVLALQYVAPPASQLVVWSEGRAGAKLARYQAWHRFAGIGRERTRVAIPQQLASSAQPCDAMQTVAFEFDATRGQVTFAEFNTRLFRQVLLCYSGAFPMDRTPVAGAPVEGTREIHNAGTKAWPRGALLMEGRVHDLPALGPGLHTRIEARQAMSGRDAAARAALVRTGPDDVAALWQLDLGGVADLPVESKAWLLVTVAPR